MLGLRNPLGMIKKYHQHLLEQCNHQGFLLSESPTILKYESLLKILSTRSFHLGVTYEVVFPINTLTDSDAASPWTGI